MNDEHDSPPALPRQAGTVYNRTFWLAYAANVSLVTANALTFRFAELVNFLGGSEKTAGAIVSTGLIVAVAARLGLSHVIDHYGTRTMWVLNSLLFVAGAAAFMLPLSLSWEIYAARVAFVVGLTGMFACSITHIQNHVPPHRRTEIIGNLGSSGFIGMILGSNLGDWILNHVADGRPQFVVLFGGAAALGVVYLVIVLVLTWNDGHDRPEVTPPAYRLLLRYWPGPVVLVALMMGLSLTVTTVFLTRFATAAGLSGIGVFFTCYAISAFTFRISARNWSRTIGRHKMLIWGLLGHTAGLLVLPLVTAEWHFVLPACSCGFGHALLFPAVVSLGTSRFPRQYRGTGTSVTLAFFDLGAILFAPLLGRLIDDFGFTSMFLASAGAMLTTAAVYKLITAGTSDRDSEPEPEEVRPVPTGEVCVAGPARRESVVAAPVEAE